LRAKINSKTKHPACDRIWIQVCLSFSPLSRLPVYLILNPWSCHSWIKRWTKYKSPTHLTNGWYFEQGHWPFTNPKLKHCQCFHGKDSSTELHFDLFCVKLQFNCSQANCASCIQKYTWLDVGIELLIFWRSLKLQDYQ